MFKRLNIIPLLAAMILCGCKSLSPMHSSQYSHFTGFDDFAQFTRTQSPDGQVVLLSPAINPTIPWNELVVSWNTTATPGTWLKVEARAQLPDHETEFYTLGKWSPDNVAFPRTTVRGQRDADGRVSADTLILKKTAQSVQLRVTLGGTNGTIPNLKFLGVSFCNTEVPPTVQTPNPAAWGKIIPTPERSQHSFP